MTAQARESWFYRPGWSAIAVTGPDAASFLHNLCTNDIKGLPADAACEALFTDVKAHVLAHAVVFGAKEDYCVVVTSPHAADLLTHLDRYHIREELELKLIDRARVALVGDQQAAEQEIPEATWRLLPSLAERGAIAVGPEDSWFADRCDAGWRGLTAEEFDRLRINRRFPLDRTDVDHRNLPQELDRDAVLINFNKGCYLGQETVARIDALGRVNQLLRAVRWQPLPDAAERDLIAGEKVVGRVTSCVANANSERANALAYVRREHATPGTKLGAEGGVEVTVLG